MNKKEIVGNKIFTISNVFTSEECEEYIKKNCENKGYEETTINTIDGPVMIKDIRNNNRFMIDDNKTAVYIWNKIKPFIPTEIDGYKPIGLNERIKFYRYDPEQYFAWHLDGYHKRNENEQSKLTFMIYLNDDYIGGETNFIVTDNSEILSIKPIKGMALLFEHRIMHEGALIENGRKYVLRSDIMYKKY